MSNLTPDAADAMAVLILIAFAVGGVIGFLVGRLWEIEKREDANKYSKSDKELL